MINELQRAVLALAQPADIQLSLFPDFVCVGDELVLDFEAAFKDLAANNHGMTPEQQSALTALDEVLTRMSGKDNASFWTDNEALRSHGMWEAIRSAARDVCTAFGWEIQRPPGNGAIYISGSGQDRPST